MPLRYYANAPSTTLATSASSVATTITLTSTAGLPISYPYTLIIDRGLSTEEVVSVTSASGATLTVTRGADATTAFAHATGAAVVHGISAQDIREANSHINATDNVHGVTTLVGATNVQTLTNKTLTDPVLTFGGISATGPLTAYTPTLTTGWALGTSTISGAYVRLGKIIVFNAELVIASGFVTSANQLGFSLPVAAKVPPIANYPMLSTGHLWTSSTNMYPLTAGVALAGDYALFKYNASLVSSSIFSFVSGYRVSMTGLYEAA